ncbi:MAG: DUF1697 domain-containing protein [Algicola sp.]|nr:DUF1697 domain-containing protein [Algicola sp.]
MTEYIVLLRGIIVGGHRKVPMAELRTLLAKIGFENVRTYIQSGNIILTSQDDNHLEVVSKIKHAIHQHFGFEVSVIAKTRDELLRIFEACPFSEVQKKASYFIILDKIPDGDRVEEVIQRSYDNEMFQIINDAVYFYSEAGYGKSKFNMNLFEKKLQVNATTRNYNTMVKLLAMSDENNKDQ